MNDGPPELGINPADLGINPIGEPTVQNEVTARLLKIDSTIQERHVVGKFGLGVPINFHGEWLVNNRSPDWEVYPNDVRIENLDRTHQFEALNNLVRRGLDRSRIPGEWESKLAESHIFAVKTDDLNNPHQANLALIYPDGLRSSGDPRPNLTAMIYFRMHGNDLSDLMNILWENPDALEEFFRIATAGLDQSLQRYTRTQLAVVDLDSFMPVEQFQHPNISFSQTVQTYQDRLDPTGHGVFFEKFSQPIGPNTELKPTVIQKPAEAAISTEPEPEVSLSNPEPTTEPISQPKEIPQTLKNEPKIIRQGFRGRIR